MRTTNRVKIRLKEKKPTHTHRYTHFEACFLMRKWRTRNPSTINATHFRLEIRLRLDMHITLGLCVFVCDSLKDTLNRLNRYAQIFSQIVHTLSTHRKTDETRKGREREK